MKYFVHIKYFYLFKMNREDQIKSNLIQEYNLQSALARFVLIWGSAMPEDETLVDQWFELRRQAEEQDFPGGLPVDISIDDVRFYLLDTPFVYEKHIVLTSGNFDEDIHVYSSNNIYITSRDIFTALKNNNSREMLGDHVYLEFFELDQNKLDTYNLGFGS
jgi:hypothetical protein